MAKRKIPPIRRQRSQREPKRRFVLFCEGKNTEPAYFSAFRRTWTGALIDIEIESGIGVPMTVAEKAVKYAKSQGLTKSSRRRKNSFEEKDEVWAVFDRDQHPKFSQAVNLCQDNNIGVARSDPCFELWLILHEKDYDQHNNHHAVQKELKKLRPEYDDQRRKIPDCNNMVTRVKSAEKRGEKQLNRREAEGCPYGNPSTTVGILTKAIRAADKLARR